MTITIYRYDADWNDNVLSDEVGRGDLKTATKLAYNEFLEFLEHNPDQHAQGCVTFHELRIDDDNETLIQKHDDNFSFDGWDD